MLDGDFGRSGKQTHHIAIIGNFSHNHLKWGLHSTDTHTVLIQDNLFALSALEHSAYASDGSDNYVIRRNVFFGSRSSGLQCNIDTVSSFHELLKHPAFRDYRDKAQLPAHLLREVRRFFEDYKVLEDKQVVVEDLLGPQEAIRIIRESLDLYRKLRRGELVPNGEKR